MTLLGVILLVLGYLLGVHLLVVLGWILVALGLILLLVGAAGNSIGGRRYWY